MERDLVEKGYTEQGRLTQYPERVSSVHIKAKITKEEGK